MLGYDDDSSGDDGLLAKFAQAEAVRSRPQKLVLAFCGGVALLLLAVRENPAVPALVLSATVLSDGSAVAACPNKAWRQCDGLNFTGVRCCAEADHCVVRSPVFSQCVPNCLTKTFHQCGGVNFTGDACCKPDYHCVVRSPVFSQCVPNCANSPHGQCGGKFFTGDTCCPRGFSCTAENEFLSSCLPPQAAPPASLVALARQPPSTTAAAAGCSTAPWMQCGGVGYKGSTCCPVGYDCTVRTTDF